jgi:hypothetical protein
MYSNKKITGPNISKKMVLFSGLQTVDFETIQKNNKYRQLLPTNNLLNK